MSTKKIEIILKDKYKDSTKLLSFTKSTFENDWCSSTHSHYFTEIIYVKSGTGHLQIENTLIPINKNNIIIVNPYTPHTEISSQTNPLSYYVLSVEGLTISLDDNVKYNIVNDSQDNIVYNFFEYLLKEINLNSNYSSDLCYHYLEIIILNICKLVNTFHTTDTIENVDFDFFKVKQYIEENYEKKITLQKLSELSNISKYHLSHKFKDIYGISPISYLNKTRVTVCKDLLKNTDYSIEEISFILGFSSLSYLSQQFKKYENMTPQKYRKLHINNN